MEARALLVRGLARSAPQARPHDLLDVFSKVESQPLRLALDDDG